MYIKCLICQQAFNVTLLLKELVVTTPLNTRTKLKARRITAKWNIFEQTYGTGVMIADGGDLVLK